MNVTILHLSDIHRTPDEPVTNDNILHALRADLKRQQDDEKLPKPDLLVITGDLTQSGREAEYKEAFTLINALKDELTVPDLSRVIVVPGNHDINWDICETIFTRTGRSKPSGVDEALIIPMGPLYLWTDEKSFARRLEPFSEFYQLMYKRDYSTDRRGQYDIWFYPELGLCFVGLNSCDRVDHFRFQGRIYEEALFEAEKSLKGKGLTESQEYLKIAVWHHDLNWLGHQNRADCLEPSILGHLVTGEYDLGLCGHTHRVNFNVYKYPGYRLPVIASGSLCAGARQRDESIPRLYNLICIEGKTVRVHTRSRDTNNDPWYPYARWGTPPCSYFDVSLREEGTDPVLRADFTAYLNYLKGETMYIDIRGLVAGYEKKVPHFCIDDIYVPLKTRYTTHTARGMKEEFSPKEVVLEEVLKEGRVYIKGDPGSGKTTFMKFIAHNLSKKGLSEELKCRFMFPEPAPLPILVRLGSLSTYISSECTESSCPRERDDPKWLLHYLDSQSKKYNWKISQEAFQEELDSGRCVILLDGLDEAPNPEEREHLSQIADNLTLTYRKCMIVMTSRPLRTGKEEPLNFRIVDIAPLDEEAIEDFLTKWCSFLYREAPDKSIEYKEELRKALKGHKEIRRMSRTPVMLTALAVVHWNERRLPEQRAELYESVLNWLFRAREKKEGRLTPEKCRRHLQQLALEMFKHPRGRQRQVGIEWAGKRLQKEFEGDKEVSSLKKAEKFLLTEMMDSGVIVQRNLRLEYWHLSFQEYLAAYEIGGFSDQKQIKLLFEKNRLYQSEWREVMLLLAGILHKQGPDRVNYVIEMIIKRGPQDSSHKTLPELAKEVALLGGIIQDLSPYKFEPSNGRYKEIVQSVMGIFDKKTFRSIPVKVREEAADALGRVGDPRFDREKDLWVYIPAGKFWMGAQKSDPKGRNYDKDAYEGKNWSESPVHEVELSAYRIGKYPVTVCQYKRFIEEGGYEDKEYWKAGGFGKFKEPGNWEEQLPYPTRPVVSVSWYEAKAYASWSGCHLPTEAQWERAARGPGEEYRKYPRGNREPDKETMNYDESGIGHPTPVGIFPESCSPEDVIDMAGNVWEWCEDWYGDYSSGKVINPTGPSKGSARVVRGGNWGRAAVLCRLAFRYGHAPAFRYVPLGFRLRS